MTTSRPSRRTAFRTGHQVTDPGLILIWGRAYLPLLFVAPVLTEFLVHRMPVSVWFEGGAVMVIGVAYAAATMVLLHPRLRFDPTLSALRDLALLSLVAATASAIVALAYTLIFALSGLLGWEQYLGAALHHWVGDAIGILVVTPFLVSVATAVRFPRPSLEMVAQLALRGGDLRLRWRHRVPVLLPAVPTHHLDRSPLWTRRGKCGPIRHLRPPSSLPWRSRISRSRTRPNSSC